MMRVTQPNKNGVDARCAKIVEILNEKLAKAQDFVKRWQELGEILFPILKEKQMLSSEELAVIVNDYRREHPDGVLPGYRRD